VDNRPRHRGFSGFSSEGTDRLDKGTAPLWEGGVPASFLRAAAVLPVSAGSGSGCGRRRNPRPEKAAPPAWHRASRPRRVRRTLR